jgi:hypothetical protein
MSVRRTFTSSRWAIGLAGALVVALAASRGRFGAASAGGEPAAAAAPAAGAASNDTVPFDHVTHAGTYEIPCLGCHVYADKSQTAGLPSARKCMGCHRFVAKDKPGVQVLSALFEKGEAPRWPHVTRLADFIYFSHRMHVRADVACSACHGEVKDMHTVVPARKLTMGFCLECHTDRKATVECIACHQ